MESKLELIKDSNGTPRYILTGEFREPQPGESYLTGHMTGSDYSMERRGRPLSNKPRPILMDVRGVFKGAVIAAAERLLQE